ncbi:MAG TPA: hypothetical protein VMI93_02480 [Candidatus Solibacter sp.]|nr:hypothetical protein [Candidatus Solibacter sp.]
MKLKAATLVICVFLTGTVVGGLAVHVFGDRIWNTRAADPAAQLNKSELLQQLNTQLQLSPEQRAQIDGIMNGTLSEYDRILTPLGPQFEQVRQQGRQRIRAVLTPDQLPKFESFIRQLDEQRAKATQPK